MLAVPEYGDVPAARHGVRTFDPRPLDGRSAAEPNILLKQTGA
jgi:hypothetical protein